MEIYFFIMCLVAGFYMACKARQKPSTRRRCVDAIIPAYNEEPCLEQSVHNLLLNPYINRVICVNDGSTDGTEAVLERLTAECGERLVVINQKNTGKGGALMHGLQYVTAEQVFLTDADTFVPYDKPGLGYMLAAIENGADAVGGIPSSNLHGAGLLPHIWATVKLPMIAIKRTCQQILGGAPFIISGACGMFKTQVLRTHGFSDRTKVEDLDLTWTLVDHGYKVEQVNRCIVYPQECNSLKDEWKRWRRWIVGYAVCMRLHRHMLMSRFGIMSILPMILFVLYGATAYSIIWMSAATQHGPHSILFALFPLAWVAIVCLLGTISAFHHKQLLLIPLAPLAVAYVLLSYTIWLVYGLKGLLTGREPARDSQRGTAMWWIELQQHAEQLAGLTSYIHPDAYISKSAVLKGAVRIEEGVVVCHGAYIEGPAIIRRNCLVGNNTVIRGSTTVGSGTRIGLGVEIKNAIIGEQVSIGPQCYIADSKVEEGVYLGAQVRTSNHRLDKQTVSVEFNQTLLNTGLEKLGCLIGAHASLGVQTIILPGRIIAPRSLFAPRITITRNLPTGRYRAKQELEHF